MTSLGRTFDSVADLYDEVRPQYPDEVYDAIESAAGHLAGSRVLDLAAGTGIATRALLIRGARVVALDPGAPMIRRLRAMTPAASAVVASAEALPFTAGSFDVVVCATAWHWLDPDPTVEEIRRVTRPGGALAIWWANHRTSESVEWESRQSDVYRRWETKHGSRPPNDSYRGVLPTQAAGDLRRRGLDVVVDTAIEWERDRARDEHLRTLATHSDVIALGDRKQQFLAEVAEALAPWPTVTERLWGPLVVARI